MSAILDFKPRDAAWAKIGWRDSPTFHLHWAFYNTFEDEKKTCFVPFQVGGKSEEPHNW